MSSKEYNIQIFSKIQQWLTEDKQYHQDRIQFIADRENELLMLQNNTRAAEKDISTHYNSTEKIALANGRRLSYENFAKMNEDKYDLILDLTVDTLHVRRNPERHSRFIKYKLEDLMNVGPYRIKLLKYMLEHPGIYVSTENAAICYGDPDVIITFEALRKTVNILRQTLGTPGPKNPYIKTKRSIVALCLCAKS